MFKTADGAGMQESSWHTQFGCSFTSASSYALRWPYVGSVLVTAEYTCTKVPQYDSTGSSRSSEDFRIMCFPVGVNKKPFVSITTDILKMNVFQKLLIFIICCFVCLSHFDSERNLAWL